ncbi:2516_t:CDS:2 [Cetraspora pellucida]|uniref:2516_t:CDS:1 n=1 Tax=Cetraspora pellucida TaxID=1433469 RepID=A0A9N9DXN7_9GLOM|nr:2516_t:CDS:2 [Cetraspora pellucida]
MRESTEAPHTFQVKFDEVEDGNLVINIHKGNLRYKKQVPSNNEVAETLTTQQNFSEYSKNSSKEEDNAGDVSNISEVDLTTTVKWHGWPINYPQDIVEKLDTSTTAKADKIKRVVKNNTGSTTIKFTRPKVFYEYLQAKGAVNINNQVC